MVEKIQQFHKSAVDARKEVSVAMNARFGSLSQDYPGYEWKIKSVKLSKDGVQMSYGSMFKLYDIVFEKKKRPNLKGHPFRGRD